MTTTDQTFVLADLAGYTAMTEAHGDEFAAQAAGEFFEGVRSLLREHQAEEVKTIGDAVLIRVPDSAAAVRLAARIISEVGRGHGALAVRAGVNTGPAVERDGDWFGACVNLTARVAAAAEPGEVLMAGATWRAAGDRLGEWDVTSRGRHTFRNVAEPVELYALTLAVQHGSSELPVDPVCRMAVDPGRSTAVRVHRGVEYHFCSQECAVVFDRHPARYTGRRSAASELRVSDQAREHAAQRLKRAYAKGRITDDELEERVEAAYGARTRGDLRAVTADLPRRRGRLRPFRWMARWIRRVIRRRRERRALRRAGRGEIEKGG